MARFNKEEAVRLLELLAESLELVNEDVDGALTVNLVVASADIAGAVLFLLSSNNQDEVVLSNLGQSSLLSEQVGGQINVAIETGVEDLLVHLLGVLVELVGHGQDHALTGREPERPVRIE